MDCPNDRYVADEAICQAVVGMMARIGIKVALKDEYFVARKLYPNVDFYSGIIYSALGIPRSMFTVMFAIARTAGWVSHWLEQQTDPENKIGRPRQIYTGADTRDYVAIDKR